MQQASRSPEGPPHHRLTTGLHQYTTATQRIRDREVQPLEEHIEGRQHVGHRAQQQCRLRTCKARLCLPAFYKPGSNAKRIGLLSMQSSTLPFSKRRHNTSLVKLVQSKSAPHMTYGRTARHNQARNCGHSSYTVRQRQVTPLSREFKSAHSVFHTTFRGHTHFN